MVAEAPLTISLSVKSSAAMASSANTGPTGKPPSPAVVKAVDALFSNKRPHAEAGPPAIHNVMATPPRDGAKAARRQLEMPITGEDTDMKVDKLRNNVLQAFQMMEAWVQDNFAKTDKRIDEANDANQGLRNEVEHFANSCPGRFAGQDAVQQNRVRLDVCVANHEQAIKDLNKFEGMVNAWTMKSDDNAGRIDYAVAQLAGFQHTMGDMTGAGFLKMKESIESVEQKVAMNLLKVGAESFGNKTARRLCE